MKVDHQENYEYQFSLISIDIRQLSSSLSIFINITEFSCFVLISVKYVMDKTLALFTIKRKEFKENFLSLEPIFL